MTPHRIRNSLRWPFLCLLLVPLHAEAQIVDIKAATDLVFLPPHTAFGRVRPAAGEFFERLPSLEMEIRWMAGKQLQIWDPLYFQGFYEYSYLYNPYDQNKSPERAYYSRLFGQHVNRNTIGLGVGLLSPRTHLSTTPMRFFGEASASYNWAEGEWNIYDTQIQTEFRPSPGVRIEVGLRFHEYLEVSWFWSSTPLNLKRQIHVRESLVIGTMEPAGMKTLPETAFGLAVGIRFGIPWSASR